MLKRLDLPGNTHVALQIWDIGGQSIGSKMLGNYIYGSQAILICYDITNFQSFQNAEDWITLVRKVFPDADQMPYMALVGNKVDMSHLRAVKSEKHTQLAESFNMKSFYVSAKTGDNVNTCFHKVAADLAGVALSKPEVEVAAKVLDPEFVGPFYLLRFCGPFSMLLCPVLYACVRASGCVHVEVGYACVCTSGHVRVRVNVRSCVYTH